MHSQTADTGGSFKTVCHCLPQEVSLSRFGGHGGGGRSNLTMSMNEPKPKRVKRQYDDEFRRNAVP
jgi:hypothetical protein